MKRSPLPIKVYFLSSEAVPFVKVGGLGDVAGALPLELNRLQSLDENQVSLDIRVAIPYHAAIDQKYKSDAPVASFEVWSKTTSYPVRVYQTKVDGVHFLLFDADVIHAANTVYSLTTRDDGVKYTLFSLAALKFLRVSGWQPDILHVNDWHTAVAAHIDRLQSKKPVPKSLLTLHNLPFMGAGIEAALDEFDIPPSGCADLPVWARTLPLPMGLAAVDKIVPVSPNYAREILTRKIGCNLNRFFNLNRCKVKGILNGIDYVTWDPAHDPAIPINFEYRNLASKSVNKQALQEEFKLPLKPDVPLLIMVSRMDIQKGVDLILETLPEISGQPWQAILLGSGDPNLEKGSARLAKRFPSRVRSVLKFDGSLSHRLYAGGDILLMPSRFEPCGLSQMISMRYGCIPVARATGGLKDTIINHPHKLKTGYLFNSPSAFPSCLTKALKDFRDRPFWESMQGNAMSVDFSWTNSAREYARLYKDLISGS